MKRLGDLLQGFKGKGQKDLPPHLKQWLKDAEAFGIPQNVQKGLLFFAGIGLGIRGVPEGQSMEAVLKRMSKHLRFDSNGEVDLPTGGGAEFASDAIGGVLLELARQVDPDFQPRTLTLPSGASFDSFNPYPGIKLPPMDEVTLASSARLSHAFYGQIGDHIQGFEPEEIIVSGLRLFNGYYQLDPENIVAVCRFALGIRPPHHAWISDIFLAELDEISSDGPFTRVMTSFCSHKSAEFFLGLMLYKKLTLVAKAHELVDPSYLCKHAIAGAREITEMGHFAKALTQYAQDLRPIPGYEPFSDNPESAAKDLLAQVRAEWGYADIVLSFGKLTSGERLDRLCCIIIAAMRDATWRVIPPAPAQELNLGLWKSKADALEIPGNIQKGLLFFTGVGILIEDMKQKTGEPNPILRQIIDLMEFQGEVLAIPAHFELRFSTEKLLSILATLKGSRPRNLGEATVMAQRAFAEIGDALQGDSLEEIIGSGLVFFMETPAMIEEEFAGLCNFLIEIRPPHMRCLDLTLYMSNDSSETDAFPAMALVANSFGNLMSESYMNFMIALACKFTDMGEQDLSGIRNIAREYAAISNPEDFLPEKIASYQKAYAAGKLELFRDSEAEAIEDVENLLHKEWGLSKAGNRYAGERYDYLCCALQTFLEDSMLSAVVR